MAPAVKRMKQTHSCLLFLCRTRLYDRTDQYFNNTASNGIQYHRSHNSHVRFRQYRWKKCQSDQTGSCKHMSCHNADPVSNIINYLHRNQIHQKLDCKIYCRNQGNLIQRQIIFQNKGQKQKWRKVIDNSLGDIPQITCIDDFHCRSTMQFIFLFYHILFHNSMQILIKTDCQISGNSALQIYLAIYIFLHRFSKSPVIHSMLLYSCQLLDILLVIHSLNLQSALLVSVLLYCHWDI